MSSDGGSPLPTLDEVLGEEKLHVRDQRGTGRGWLVSAPAGELVLPSGAVVARDASAKELTPADLPARAQVRVTGVWMCEWRKGTPGGSYGPDGKRLAALDAYRIELL